MMEVMQIKWTPKVSVSDDNTESRSKKKMEAFTYNSDDVFLRQYALSFSQHYFGFLIH